MTALFETERLRLRRLTAGDVDNVLRLTSDAEVMRYIGDGATDDREAAKNRLARLMSHYEKYPGLGFWAVEHKSKNKFIGWFALKYIPKTVEVEIGYLFLKSAWGQGFATEGARALLSYGFDEVGLNRIVAVAHVENKASQNVMKKIGLRDCGIGHYYDHDVAYFVGERFEFANPKA
jgi:[ribosomal protein S5]-alanine N-acetyltransferase